MIKLLYFQPNNEPAQILNNRVRIGYVVYLNLYCMYDRHGHKYIFFHAKIMLCNWYNMGYVSSSTNYIHVMF